MTIKQYKVVLNTWRSFENEVGQTFLISDFVVKSSQDENKSKKIIEKFRRFLIDKGGNGIPLSDNSTRAKLKTLNTFFRWCEKELDTTLIRNVRMSGEMISKYSISLTKEEVNRIRNVKLDPESHLHHIRNFMVLMTSLGLRFSEWGLIRPELYKEPYQLIVSPKTGKSCLVIHRDEVRQILSQYEKTGIPRSVLTNQVVNRSIKEVCELSGLTRMVHKTLTRDGVDHHQSVPLYSIVSTHTLRRTKITLDLNEGRPMRDVVMETGQDELIVKKHYDRRNLDEFVSSLGIQKVE